MGQMHWGVLSNSQPDGVAYHKGAIMISTITHKASPDGALTAGYTATAEGSSIGSRVFISRSTVSNVAQRTTTTELIVSLVV